MKKIINGKKYDTATARLVGKWLYGNGKRDFYLQHEKLFCKKTGEYFLHAKGGPLSVYHTYSGSNSWGGGEVVIPYTLREAQKWAMEHMDGDAYEAEFGEVDE